MKLTSKIQKAINVAAQLHLGQVRKSEDRLPYIVHPFAVAWILSDYTEDEEVVMAALLHDVLEDVDGYEFENLVADFGERVANIVKGVSEERDPIDHVGTPETWMNRKNGYLWNLETAPEESLLVSAADKINNLHTMIDAYQSEGEVLWERFHSPADKRLWFYEEVYKLIERRLGKVPLVEKFERSLIKAREVLL
jgi:(p)ppGpp synthase/HD superfamily hydrolase